MNSTDSKVEQMFELAFGETVDAEKRKQVSIK